MTTRRQFLTSVGLAAGASLLPRALSAQSPAPSAAPLSVLAPTPLPPPAWMPEYREIRRQVGIFTGRGGTIGWLSDAEGVMAVDSQFPDTMKAFLGGVPLRAGRKLDLLFNTHHHWDHTGGNQVAAPQVKVIVAHEKVPGLQKAGAEAQKTEADQVYATELFAQEWKQSVGKETLSARHYGPGHTGGDAVLHFEKAQVLHVGDLVFNRLYPFIDRRGGASVKNWIVVLEAIAKDFGSETQFIFGHGKKEFGVIGKREDVLAARDYLTGLLEFVHAHVKAGKTKADLVSVEEVPKFPDHRAPKPNRLQQNLEATFDEVTAG